MSFFNKVTGRHTSPEDPHVEATTAPRHSTDHSATLPAPVTATTPTTSRNRRGWKSKLTTSKGKHGRKDRTHDLNHPPTFKQWLRLTWVDILTIIAMALILMGTSRSQPLSIRYFPILEGPSGVVVNPDIAQPSRPAIITVAMGGVIPGIVPFGVFCIMQWRVRSFWDFNNAVMGLLYSIVTGAFISEVTKLVIGGVRPHFLDACKPDLSKVGEGFQNLYFTKDVCTAPEEVTLNELKSFPSGHSITACAGFVFLYLYLNAKLKVWSNYRPQFWKLVGIHLPLLGALLIVAAMVLDGSHHWYDCVIGAMIGTMVAFSSYRTMYASIFDFRFNHVPLLRHVAFGYGMGHAGAGGFDRAVWSRRVGWGSEEGVYCGAPFDAGYAMRDLGVGKGRSGEEVEATTHHHEKRHHRNGNGPVMEEGRGDDIV